MPYSSFLLACACVCILFYSLQYSSAGNNVTDQMALLEIKAKIQDPLFVLSSWNDSLHFCEWFGVTCGRKHERVTALNLSSSKLTGIISPHLGNLTFLRELHLHDNNFGGIIPSEIGCLHRLEALSLYDNSIGGEIPSNISGCFSLTDLSLDSNRLVGGIPPMFGSLFHLQFLYLSSNNLTGNILSSLGNLSSLVELYIGDNNLVGRIPDSLGKLNNLTYLALGGNKLIGVVPPSIFNLSLLTTLGLELNKLEGNLPSYLGDTLPYLQTFSIADNGFTGDIPSSISNCSYLELLQLGINNLKGQVPSLHKLVRLNTLNLDQNSLGYGKPGDLDFLSTLANATNLQWLFIHTNKFKGNFPNSICKFTSLNKLNLATNDLAGIIPSCIQNLSKLNSFDASENSFSGVIPEGIGKLQHLDYLDLSGNQLQGVIPSTIGNLTQLTELHLGSNNLEGQIPSTIEYCKLLLLLNLSNNRLSGRIPSQLFNLPVLSIGLNLSTNHLTGPLPDAVGQLKNLDVLDVSQNMLSGILPSSLGSCVSLEYLLMGRNCIHGSILDALQSLKGLLVIDLSENNLSGEIPKFLTSFKLKVLDLQHNNFEGEVPIDGVFNNASGGLFITGNSRLCGGIPKLMLPRCVSRYNTGKARLEQKKILIIAIVSGLFGVVMLLVFLVLLYIIRKRKRTLKATNNGDDSENFPNLSYQNLLRATNGFSSENLIGSGTFGVVYKGILDELGCTIAIKVFNLQNYGASKSFMAECGVLRNIRHRNLLKVITVCSSVDHQGNDFKALVYEYMENGSLEDWLHPTEAINNLNFRKRLDIAVEIAYAVDYLHNDSGRFPIIHCDLKPSNVLLDNDMVTHVGDFGLAKFLLKDSNSDAYQSSSVGVRGTFGYAPPGITAEAFHAEYGVGNEVSTSGDVYSFGILLLEMFTGKRPTNDMFKGGLSLHGFVKEGVPEQVIEILDHALVEEIDCEEADSSLMLEALTTTFEIALSCSTELPHERPKMSDVATKLSSVRNKFLGTHLQHRRRIQAGIQR